MKATLLLLLFCLLSSQAADNFVTDKQDPQAAGMDPARLAQISARMREYVAAHKTAGVVTLVARHGSVASVEAVGYQNLETKTPMRTDTIFRIASMTKPVSCAALMVLVDEGRVSLIDPVEKYLPEFKGLKVNPCENAGRVQLRATSAHPAGQRDGPDDAHFRFPRFASAARRLGAAERHWLKRWPAYPA